jgi:hypothetical protein
VAEIVVCSDIGGFGVTAQDFNAALERGRPGKECVSIDALSARDNLLEFDCHGFRMFAFRTLKRP